MSAETIRLLVALAGVALFAGAGVRALFDGEDGRTWLVATIGLALVVLGLLGGAS